MKGILKGKKGLLGILLMIFLVTFSPLGAIGLSHAGDGGIGDPADGLQSPEPQAGDDGTGFVELHILYEALSFVL